MPGQTDKERLDDFKEYISNLKGWTIDKSLKDLIFDKICRQTGERLDEFIKTFQMLLVYTDKRYKKDQHRPDMRKIKPKGIKKGMHVSLIIEPYKKPDNYLYTMKLYFTYNQVIYDLEIGSQTL